MYNLNVNLHEPDLLKTLALHAPFLKNLSEREGPAQVGRAAGREGRGAAGSLLSKEARTHPGIKT